MFGYIAPALSILSDEQKQRYRSHYCGVCHALLLRHGQAGRLSLSNDMTFLSVLLSSLYEPESGSRMKRCAVHPLKKHNYVFSCMTDYAADMNVLLFYYKCMDQRKDDRSIPGAAGESIFRSRIEKIRQEWPDQSGQVENALRELWEEEKRSAPDPDRLCNLSGNMLGAVFVPLPDDPWSGLLRKVGESLGRFVYWMDAWEDLDEDIRRKRFNPLASYRQRPDYDDFCTDTLELLIAEATESFELLPLEKDLDLLRNILYSGVWQRYTLLNEKKKRKEGAHGQ